MPWIKTLGTKIRLIANAGFSRGLKSFATLGAIDQKSGSCQFPFGGAAERAPGRRWALDWSFGIYVSKKLKCKIETTELYPDQLW